MVIASKALNSMYHDEKERTVEQDARSRQSKRPFRSRPAVDPIVKDEIHKAEIHLVDAWGAYTIKGFNGFQRKCVHEHFEKTQEYRVKSYRENGDCILKIYPVGKLQRLAEQKAQEVLMMGTPVILPPMGAFERFVIHDYLKEREGIKTVSFGNNGLDRHVEIHPLFGRTLKKARRRLTR